MSASPPEDPGSDQPLRPRPDVGLPEEPVPLPQPDQATADTVADPPVSRGVSDPDQPEFTRISALWVAVGVVLVIAILLLIFILQNLQRVRIHYLGLSPSLPLGVALLIAAVAGAVVVAISGALRVLQLRRATKKTSTSQ